MSTRFSDRVAALEISCRTELDGIVRAVDAGNNIAAEINRQRLLSAENAMTNLIKTKANPPAGKQKLCGNKQRNKFPCTRPLDGHEVDVFDVSGNYLGAGVGAVCRRSGGCIVVNGVRYDSNHTLLWQHK